MLNYFTSEYKDLSKGINQHSVPNLIADGYSQDLVNVVTNSEGHLEKRKGYQGYYGYVPLRVETVDYNAGGEIVFNLPGAIDLSEEEATPIIVEGKLGNSSMDGDFVSTSTTTKYYPTFTVVQPITLLPGSGTLTREASATGIDSNAIAAGLSISTNPGSQSNSNYIYDESRVDAATYELNVDYTNGTGSSFDSYFYYLDKSISVGTIFHKSFAAQSSVSITAVEHGLSNFNLLMQCEELTGGEYRIVLPDTASLNPTTGAVDITFSSAITGRIILTAAPITNSATGTAPANDQVTVEIPSPDTSFNFVTCYLESGAVLNQVIPDDISYDAATDILSVTFTNTTSTSTNFEMYYESADIAVNAIKVSGTVTSIGTDTQPQLTLWGVPHSDIYIDETSGGGKVNHIDSYKKVGESRLICGLGGNIFRTIDADELGETVAPYHYLNLRNRINTDSLLAPVFQSDSDPLVARSRGTILGSNVEDNKAVITGASYDSINDRVDYVLDVTDLDIVDSVGDPAVIGDTLSVAAGLEDYLTVTQMGHSRLNGVFKIKAVANVGGVVTLSVENSNVDNTDYDETDAGGRAAVYTDQVTFQAASKFQADDIVNASTFISSANVVVTSSLGSTIVVTNINRAIEFPGGLRIYASRIGNTFPLRSYDGTADVQYLVRGDMLEVTGINRKIRIISIDVTNSTVTFDESLTLSDNNASTISVRPVGRWYTIETPDNNGDLVDTTQTYHWDAESYTDQSILRSTMINDSMFFTNDQDEVMKFDGTNVYRAGLPRWQANLFSNIDETTDTFNVLSSPVASVTGNEIVVGVSEIARFEAGDTVYHTEDGAYYTVTDTDNSTNTVYVDATVTGTTGSGAYDLNLVQQFRYYFRLNAIDANNNIVASASTGSENFRVRVNVDGQPQIKLVGLPAWDIYDYDRIELQVFRTRANVDVTFYNIASIPIDFNNTDGYIIYQDDVPDEALGSGNLGLAEGGTRIGESLPLGWAEPVRGKFITSASNKLILGNVKDYPKYDIVFRKLLTNTEFTKDDLLNTNENRFLFRKDNTDDSTETNMIDRAAYEFVDADGALPTSIVPTTDISKIDSTTIEIAMTAHGLYIGNWIYLYHSAEGPNNDLTFAGWYQIHDVPSDDTFRILTSAARAGIANDVDTLVTANLQNDVPVLLGTDGNLTMKDGNSDTRPYGTLAAFRLASAINASMRQTNIAINFQSTFEPWLMAAGGDEYGEARLVVHQPRVFDTDSELVFGSATGTSYKLFVNNINRPINTEESVGAVAELHPSRIIVSYANYPEIFDGPITGGTSVIDINTADGQDITGVIPFFADTAFGASQKEAMIVVFKSESIYLVNTATREVQKIDSQGLGCTMPYSIAPTRNGIMFANRSGIYKLNYNLTISYAGEMLENVWLNDINRDATESVTAHHYAIERRYELSVPVAGTTTNTQVLVYDHTREGREQEYGAWSKYTNFDVTGWANLENDAFFATNHGEVFSIRRLQETSDYRDDASAVDEMIIITKPFTTGSGGIRHKLRAIMSHFKIDGAMTGTTLDVAVDLSNNFVGSGTFSVSDPGSSNPHLDRQVVTLRSSVSNQKFIYLQLKYRNSTIDESVILSAINLTSAPLSRKGIQETNYNNGNINS